MVAQSRAEYVLQAMLDGVSVDVDEIRLALDEVRSARPNPQQDVPLPLVIAATELISANDRWIKAFEDDDIDMDGEYDRVQASIEAIRNALPALA